MDLIAGILHTSLLAGGVLALAALGEVLAERVGVGEPNVAAAGMEGHQMLQERQGLVQAVLAPQLLGELEQLPEPGLDRLGADGLRQGHGRSRKLANMPTTWLRVGPM